MNSGRPGLRAVVGDGVIAVGVAAILLANGLSERHPASGSAVLGAVLLVVGGGALAARRRAPTTVLAVTGLCAVGSQALGFDVPAVAYLLFRERPSNRFLYAAPVLLGGIVLAGGLAGTPAFGPDPVLGAVLALGAGVGLVPVASHRPDRGGGGGNRCAAGFPEPFPAVLRRPRGAGVAHLGVPPP